VPSPRGEANHAGTTNGTTQVTQVNPSTQIDRYSRESGIAYRPALTYARVVLQEWAQINYQHPHFMIVVDT